jgi:uncharacterized membrane protein (UPF0182 family)
MYVLLIVVLIAAGIALTLWGLQTNRKWLSVGGRLLLVATVAFFAWMSFWGEMLWFAALGYHDRFWTVILAFISVVGVAALAGGIVVYLLTWFIPRKPPVARIWPELLGVLLGAAWGARNWQVVLKFLNQVTAGVSDPILGRDVGFYLFALPFYDAVFWLLFVLAAISLFAAMAFLWMPRREEEIQLRWWQRSGDRAYADYRPLYAALGALGIVLAWRHYLNMFHLMYSHLGAVAGPGWTDVNVRLPAYWFLVAVTAVASVWLLVMAVARQSHDWATKRSRFIAPIRVAVIPIASVAVLWLVALQVVPSAVQWLAVEPNEITLERPYLEHNIEFTRRAFQLDKVEEREFPASAEFTQETAEANQHVLSQVRLWDPRALVQVYKQFQEIRLYYEFSDVDIDRYTIDGDYRQVMVSPREMNLENLPHQSQTFVNRHFKYTHGYGLTLAPVNKFTSNGLPDLLVKDLPPKAQSPDLQIARPQIYYGELTDDYVVVNSKEEEFDYPRGQENAYTRYDGRGGVQLDSLWRRFVYGWKLGGTRLFLSSYPTDESRIQFRRQVRERVKALAPFLHFDHDPYIVLADGKLYWIIDAYTTSSYYPYSEPFSWWTSDAEQRVARPQIAAASADYLYGANYARNSVKAVVDAYEGSVTFYVFEPDDPIVQVWQNIFPGLLKSKEEMPENLLAHVRYPEGFLLAQGLVYAKYHMTDPTVFYNQEDLWVRATEKYYAHVQPVEPYYVMWEPPETDSIEFVQILPFTPKNRQVLIGWIAGMCDGENYGRLLSYRFPKEKRVLGPQQVETKIDQDSHLAGQLTLWDQRGSNVIRGNVLAIPVDDTLLYVEPIYLQAEAAAYPELRLVAVMQGDRLSYAEEFDEAIRGLYGAPTTPSPTSPGAQPFDGLARRANAAFEDYLQALSDRRFDKVGEALKELSSTLETLARQSPGPERTAGRDQPGGPQTK